MKKEQNFFFSWNDGGTTLQLTPVINVGLVCIKNALIWFGPINF